MPFVFVHGVNNRKDADYIREEKLRAAFLKEIVAPVAGINPSHDIIAPFWGGDGVKFWRDLAVIPSGNETETFGKEEELLPSIGIAHANGEIVEGDSLVSIAHKAPHVAIDLLFDSIAQGALSETDFRVIARAYKSAQNRLAQTDSSWLTRDSQNGLLTEILDEMEGPKAEEVFGGQRLWDMLNEGARRLSLFPTDQLSHALVRLTRRTLTHKIATFVGDSYRYLDERGDGSNPGPIASTVLGALRDGQKISVETGEPLGVICHRFGGEILYDNLTKYADGSDLEIDTWITVGSQVGLFEEMSLLLTSPGRHDQNSLPREAVPSPVKAKRWINIFDTNDVLGFAVLPTFTATNPGTVKDYKYNTGYAVTGAHSGYFKWPSFYKRLAARLSEGG